MGHLVEQAIRAGATLGEGPSWDDRSGRLVFVDILAGHVLAATPGGDPVVLLDAGQAVGAARLREAGGLVAAVRDGFLLVDAEGTIERHIPVEADVPTRRMNDAACDPLGRLWAGTMEDGSVPGLAALYRLDPDGTVHCNDTGLWLSNGIGWSPDGCTMYHVDSTRYAVEVLDYDVSSGRADGRRLLLQTPREWGLPDGLTVAVDGTLFVAFWDGSAVRRFDPTGGLLETIAVPVARPTATCLVGSTLYITTALPDGGRDPAQPLAGDVLAVDVDATGQPGVRFAG